MVGITDPPTTLHPSPSSPPILFPYTRSLKTECIRAETPLSLDDSRRIVGQFVARYNEVRLHSAIGLVTPKDKLEGRDTQIVAARDRKLEAARAERKVRRQATLMRSANDPPFSLRHTS